MSHRELARNDTEIGRRQSLRMSCRVVCFLPAFCLSMLTENLAGTYLETRLELAPSRNTLAEHLRKSIDFTRRRDYVKLIFGKNLHNIIAEVDVMSVACATRALRMAV